MLKEATRNSLLAFIQKKSTAKDFGNRCIALNSSSSLTFALAFFFFFLLILLSPAAVRAQIAVISERLSAVLGRGEDENQAASLNSRVQVNVPDPRIEAPYQNVSVLELGVRRSAVSLGAGGGSVRARVYSPHQKLSSLKNRKCISQFAHLVVLSGEQKCALSLPVSGGLQSPRDMQYIMYIHSVTQAFLMGAYLDNWRGYKTFLGL